MIDSTRLPRSPMPPPTSRRARIFVRVSITFPSGTASRITRPRSPWIAMRYWGASAARSRRIARPVSPRRAFEISDASPMGWPSLSGSAESPCTRPFAPTIVMRAPVTAASRGASRSGCPAIRSQSATSPACFDMRRSTSVSRSLARVRSIAISVPAPATTTSTRNVASSLRRSELRTGDHVSRGGRGSRTHGRFPPRRRRGRGSRAGAARGHRRCAC